jgi:hypothetical protein
MSKNDKFVVLGLGIHAIVGLHVLILEDGVLRVEKVSLSEHLHQ